MSGTKRSPLFEAYKDYPGIKLVDFAGWELPLHFQAGIIGEHLCVRRAAGLFDVSHMGEIEIDGPGATALVDWLVTNDVRGLSVGHALYSPMCYPNGGVVDDLLVYRLSADRYMLVVNAANTAKDLSWIERENPRMNPSSGMEASNLEVSIIDRSDDTALIAFQGPSAAGLLRGIAGAVVDELGPFEFRASVDISGVPVLLSRTGYTGEDGFELFVRSVEASKVWRTLSDHGRQGGVLPCGLGARDTLRIEARLPLYGQELSPEITPLEAGLKTFVKLDKEEFCGKEALLELKATGVPRSLRGFRMIDKGVPRPGYTAYADGQQVGTVTSGLKSPMLDAFVGLVLARAGSLAKGMEIEIDVGGRRKRAVVVATPFYKNTGGKT